MRSYRQNLLCAPEYQSHPLPPGQGKSLHYIPDQPRTHSAVQKDPTPTYHSSPSCSSADEYDQPVLEPDVPDIPYAPLRSRWPDTALLDLIKQQARVLYDPSLDHTLIAIERLKSRGETQGPCGVGTKDGELSYEGAISAVQLQHAMRMGMQVTSSVKGMFAFVNIQQCTV
jgi:hypothetical protein